MKNGEFGVFKSLSNTSFNESSKRVFKELQNHQGNHKGTRDIAPPGGEP